MVNNKNSERRHSVAVAVHFNPLTTDFPSYANWLLNLWGKSMD